VRVPEAVRAGLVGGGVAALVSGAPSTLHALATGRDPLEATLAAGSLALPRERRRRRLLAAAVPVHLGISLGWGVALAVVLPRRGTVPAGAVAGLGIAALDLGAVGRRHPPIRALAPVPQAADHLLFGIVVAGVVARRRAVRPAARRPGPSPGVAVPGDLGLDGCRLAVEVS
jgi:hypothetical protein